MPINPGQSRILDSRDPDSVAVELEFRIPVVSDIPDSLSWIPDSEAQDSGFHKQKIFQILESG